MMYNTQYACYSPLDLPQAFRRPRCKWIINWVGGEEECAAQDESGEQYMPYMGMYIPYMVIQIIEIITHLINFNCVKIYIIVFTRKFSIQSYALKEF